MTHTSTTTLQHESHWARHMNIVVPAQHADVVHQVLDGQAVLYDVTSGRTHRMNETALTVWQACDGRSTTRQVAARLVQMYDVPFETAIEDVEQCIAALAHAGLLAEPEER